MDWFWGSSGKNTKSDDPYKKLDPKLREYLDQATPSSSTSNTSPLSQPSPPRDEADQSIARSASTSRTPTTNYRAQLGLDVPGVTPEAQNAPPRNNTPSTTTSSPTATVPAESLFQDGRYADLWKTYRSSTDIAAHSRSDQDRLADIADAYNDRKAATGRAAVENCVFEQMDERDCYRNGTWRQTMTMCRPEARAFYRCYTMQARFLTALGYMSNASRGPEDEEKIQMHADRLYHEMLAREEAQERARQEGQEVPVFQPLIRNESIEQALGADSAWSRARRFAQEKKFPTSFSEFDPKRQEEIREKIKGLSEQERELELQLIAAEQRAQLEYAQQIDGHMAEERSQRAARREKGKETFGDSMKRLWGWDK